MNVLDNIIEDSWRLSGPAETMKWELNWVMHPGGLWKLDTMRVIWETSTTALQLRRGVSVSPIVPKTPCDRRGRGDEDRTGARGQQWAYCPLLAWYGLTAREWYQAKTTDLIQSALLSAAAGWWGGRIIIEVLFQLALPTPASISLNFTSGAVCPHTSKS